MSTLEWFEAVERIKYHVVRISTPRGSGTGFLLYMGTKSPICALATAAHVIDKAHYWEEHIRLEHAVSGKSIIVRHNERAIFIDENMRDTAAIVVKKDSLPFPNNALQLAPKEKYLKEGNSIGWVGYPAVAPTNLCFFGGQISAWAEEKDAYLVDGVAINGVSGGPAFKIEGDHLVVIGVVSAYIPNRAMGEALPGLALVRSVTQFHELAPRFNSFDQAKAEETNSASISTPESNASEIKP